MTAGWEPASNQQPLPPQNVTVTCPYQIGVQDIRWDDPALLAGNSVYQVVGVNIYRSDVSDRGPFYLLNTFPLGGGFYRDQTFDRIVTNETVQWDRDWVFRGNAPNSREWTFKTKFPIVKRNPGSLFQSNQKPTYANAPTDVMVHIDGVEAEVHFVLGVDGTVTLVNTMQVDPNTEQYVYPVLPTETSVVEVTYYTSGNHIHSGLDMTTWYRISTVVADTTSATGFRETELSWCQPTSIIEVEKLDYIWKEAVRRNNWILQQGGERVKLFIRKTAGVRCTCRLDNRRLEYNKQPKNDCHSCFGTGWIGGYDGPYDIILAPDNAEHRISQTPYGRRKEQTYDVFMGPSPVVTQRDIIVKQTNERYSIGPVTRPTNRGNLLQQHFNIAYLDEQDIRSQIPISGTDILPWPQTRYGFRQVPALAIDGSLEMPPSTMPDKPAYPVGPLSVHPMESEEGTMPDEKEQRGRTPAWHNINRS
jgi:hypothetical protein